MLPIYPSYKTQALAPDPPKYDVQWVQALAVVSLKLWFIAKDMKYR